MKKLAKEPAKCIGCRACEGACETLWKGEQRVWVTEAEGGYAIKTCTQCGECVIVCPGAALSKDNNGVVRLDKSRCVGCLMCVGYCPELTMAHKPESTVPYKCSACGACAKACPTGALFMELSND